MTMPSIPSSGRFEFKISERKDEIPVLEFVSNNPNADKNKNRRAKESNKRNERVTSSVAKSHGLRGKSQRGNHPKSPRPPKKSSSEHDTVTLDDVKEVAHGSLLEGENVPVTFDGIFQEPSIKEREEFEAACEKLNIAQKMLGQSHGIMVLGLGMESEHHMSCGKSRVSATLRDRHVFEVLYKFCLFVVYITFKRKLPQDVIRKEIGRMLRSDTFNPAIRVKQTPDPKDQRSSMLIKKALKEFREIEVPLQERKGISDLQEVFKFNAAEYRRNHPRRPAIKSIIHQRSPALVAVLPSASENSEWLFRRSRPLSPNSLSKIGREEGEDEMDSEDNTLDQIIEKKTFKVGIIGDPKNLYSADKLMPVGGENEDEENEEDGSKRTQPETKEAEPQPPPGRVVARKQTLSRISQRPGGHCK
ncbi:protein phosphatase 1 regulatory subunit 36 [Mytilus galloprovincialis]|uniref:Protein phosphatase 1 regulatory subunit 36 n=1 Tax=Mytilus galloprovincialis TaxID=29158 RepID=A0A8B6CHI6_MYTGA|nr:protein phosphatase 1 regulatory subunit 36 [Mytilus galloprovincialis]